MDLLLAAACDEARERPDGKLDLIGVFSELSAPGFPAVQEHMVAVFVIEWDEPERGRQELKAELRDENGRTILTIEGHTDVFPRQEGAGRPRTQLIVPLERLVFPAAGRFDFQLTAGATSLFAFALLVTEHPAHGTDPEPGPRV